MDFILPFLLWLPVAWSPNQITRWLGVTIEKAIVIYGLHITLSIVTPSRLESQSNHQATGNHNRKGNIWTLYYLFYCNFQSPGDLIVTPGNWESHYRKGNRNFWTSYYLFYCDSQSPGVTIKSPGDWESQ